MPGEWQLYLPAPQQLDRLVICRHLLPTLRRPRAASRRPRPGGQQATKDIYIKSHAKSLVAKRANSASDITLISQARLTLSTVITDQGGIDYCL